MESDKSINNIYDKNHPKLSLIVFHGPAGTGKSRRAQLIARNLDVDFIIDDGLVIHRGRIACGKSAKSEKNQIKAIRRALFQYKDHKNQVKNFLEKQSGRVMLLATSKDMALKIIKTLNLPDPEKYISIQEVATASEIKKAKKERRDKKQHVIPVSQVQVRKNFAGQLVGKFRVFLQPLYPQDGEKTIVRPPFTFYGDLKIDPEALNQIVNYIAIHTDQVLSIESNKIKNEDDNIHISIEIFIKIGSRNFIEISKLLQKRIKTGLEYFTGLTVKSVDVIVSGLDL
ncbi:hypothetical protein KAR29_07000 [Aminithiophilus ramosus]|uniref:Asp23/Gls24 family envelope stress response protein n=2 Tax=Synergistales TaxID=649776 RepID=A0A9Q7AIR1_9BACT|nr:hypothetical protein [Aminithiophilus ramosus]QTX33589.1 hypothetical protein KAR29_07000 [Aminithiophilus ramosus]QVL37444.1 hypothetical protein KIH16_06855 [Synergistota bacterium]